MSPWDNFLFKMRSCDLTDTELFEFKKGLRPIETSYLKYMDKGTYIFFNVNSKTEPISYAEVLGKVDEKYFAIRCENTHNYAISKTNHGFMLYDPEKEYEQMGSVEFYMEIPKQIIRENKLKQITIQ